MKLIDLIDEILYREWFPKPKTYKMRKELFLKKSYENWAIIELREYALLHKNLDPITCVEQFRDLLNFLSTKYEDQSVRFMYSTAYDVITQVLDMILVDTEDQNGNSLRNLP